MSAGDELLSEKNQGYQLRLSPLNGLNHIHRGMGMRTPSWSFVKLTQAVPRPKIMLSQLSPVPSAGGSILIASHIYAYERHCAFYIAKHSCPA